MLRIVINIKKNVKKKCSQKKVILLSTFLSITIQPTNYQTFPDIENTETCNKILADSLESVIKVLLSFRFVL